MTIQQWLDSPEHDYALGLALYTAHGRNTNLLRTFQLFRRKEYCHEKLEYELRKIADSAEDTAPISVAVAPKAAKSKAQPVEKPATNPNVLTAKDLIVERNKLSNSLHDFADDDNAGRLPVVQQIKGLNKKIYAVMQGLELKDAPAPAVIEEATVVLDNALDLLRAIQNGRSNLTKWKNKRDNASPSTAKHQKASAKVGLIEKALAAWQARLEALKTKPA